MRIAAVIITKNEEASIERCVRSLSFCDEILVVDAQSTDRTCALAEKAGARVVSRAWTGYADQRNFGASCVQSDWVLSVDADEEVSDELREELVHIRQAPPENIVAYTVPRKTLHSGRWIRWGGWYPNRLVRFFKRSQGVWIGDEVHEYWDATGEVGNLKSDLIHYSFDNIFDQVERNNRYSTLGAVALTNRGRRFSTPMMLLKPFTKFVETYFLKFGFLDGFQGFVISVSAAYSVFLKWAKLRELRDAA